MLLIAALVALPVLALLASWLSWDAAAMKILSEMARTVLPEYIWTSLLLCFLVGAGVMLIGAGTAAAVTLFDFPGRKILEWALLLPMAMPAYVVAYAYTDFLQFSGPLQTMLRELLGLQGRLLPEVRSVAGAAWVFTFTLYPYVYLLSRAAFAERATHLMEAARLLGAPLRRRIWQVALPLARPALAAGVALALMETLADFGVSSYFGIQTFSTGIFKAWLALDNQVAAAQLATMLLLLIAFLLKLEQGAQRRMRFASSKGSRGGGDDGQPVLLHGRSAAAAVLVCLLPVLMGFVLPLLFMLRPLSLDSTSLPWARFAEWTWNSLRLGLVSAVLAVALAWFLSFRLRRRPDALTRHSVQLVGLGYAVPGAVIVVGILLPVGWLQSVAPQTQIGYLMTATSVGLTWAYLVRFTPVALQSMQSGYARIAVSLDDSARMLGTNDWGLLRRLHWPLLRRSTVVAALLVFVDVMKELPATLVLRPFDTDTLAVVAYQLARDERLGEAALPSLALVLAGLIPVLLLSRTLRTPGRSA